MTDKIIDIMIDDYKKTIARLQQECTEKTNSIISLGEQLASKTEECEKLKTEIIKGGGTLSDKVRAEVFTTLENELQAERQEVKKLKRQKDLLYIKATDKVSKLEWAYNKRKEKSDRYKQALEEIKPKLQEIYNTAGSGATTYQERLINEINEILQKCEVLND